MPARSAAYRRSGARSERDQSPEGGIPDIQGMYAGPVAGLWAIAKWMETNRPDNPGFYTVPVDAPFLQHDVFEKLQTNMKASVARTALGLQPTFAYWNRKVIIERLQTVSFNTSISLKHLASLCEAKQILFPSLGTFSNINTPEDLSIAENALASGVNLTNSSSEGLETQFTNAGLKSYFDES